MGTGSILIGHEVGQLGLQFLCGISSTFLVSLPNNDLFFLCDSVALIVDVA